MKKEILFVLIVMSNIALFLSAWNLEKINLKISEKPKKEIITKGIIFLIVIFIEKYLTYEIEKFKVDTQLTLDLLNGNFKFLFNKGENPILTISEYVINISQSLEIYLGIISVLVAIYIYSISLGDDFKKYVLLTLLGEGKVLYLTVFLLILYFFNISPICFVALILMIFSELCKMIKETFRVMNTMYFKENWKNKIILQLKKNENAKILENIYYELRKRIIKAMNEKDFLIFGEMIFYYKHLLMTENLKFQKILHREVVKKKMQYDFYMIFILI